MTNDERNAALLKARELSDYMRGELMAYRNSTPRRSEFPDVTATQITEQLILLTDLVVDLIERKV